MTRGPTKATVAGRTYRALQKKAREGGRTTDELLQLFALDAFVDPLSTSPAAENLVLKGGVLLAAYDMRRPTRDVDLSARNLDNNNLLSGSHGVHANDLAKSIANVAAFRRIEIWCAPSFRQPACPARPGA